MQKLCKFIVFLLFSPEYVMTLPSEGDKALVLTKEALDDPKEFIDRIYTIAGFACKICNTLKPNYNELKAKLEDYYISGSFPYNHVIIDEGQDFGSEAIEALLNKIMF